MATGSSKAAQALDAAAFALQMQRPAEAEKLAAGVLRNDRGNVGAAELLGRALLMQRRAADAIEPLQRAAKRTSHPGLETLLAAALGAAGKRDEALAQLRQTTTRRPAFPQAFLELGNQLGKLGRLDEAVAVLEDGIALAPQLVELRVELGFISLKRNDRVRARALFEEILKAAPGRLDATIGLANTRTFDGNYAEAAELYRRALTQRPNDPALRNGLAVCLLELGDRTAGEAALRDLARNPQMASQAMLSLAGSSHGRFFLRPSAAAKFLQG